MSCSASDATAWRWAAILVVSFAVWAVITAIDVAWQLLTEEGARAREERP